MPQLISERFSLNAAVTKRAGTTGLILAMVYLIRIMNQGITL